MRDVEYPKLPFRGLYPDFWTQRGGPSQLVNLCTSIEDAALAAR